MPTLDWIGKKAVIGHHREVPFHLLKTDEKLSVGEPGSGNLLIEGDNLLALKALLPYYAGKVKCIYIDPPYNTGNENWVYNDAVNSSEMRNWLGKVVGRELEDLSRHDKWLCMMYPRLSLLKEFLREDGIILISIDDYEMSRLKLLADEIFGPLSWVASLIWKRRASPDSRNINGISADHEYILVYGKSKKVRFRGADKDLTKYKNPDNDPLGEWMSDNLTGLANASERPNLHYDVVNPITGWSYKPHPSRGWIYGRDKIDELIRQGRILWPRKSSGRPRLKRYLFDMKSETTGFSTLLEAPSNVSGTKELAKRLGTKTFAFPKPIGLIKILLKQVTEQDSIVMDAFAGSATTGEATLELNASDKGRRKYILIEIDGNICQNVAAKRLTIANDSSKEGFLFCRLGPTLFDETGAIRAEVSFGDLASHVYFSETGEPIPKMSNGKSPFLGVHNGVAVYLLYNGILGDKRSNGGNVFTQNVLKNLPPHDGPKVIYGTGCRLGTARLKREGIVFKQIPYAIKVS